MILSSKDVAARLGVSVQRVHELNDIRAKKGLPRAGQQFTRHSTWMFTEEDIALLQPRKSAGRPSKAELS